MFFGKTFAHLLLIAYPEIAPKRSLSSMEEYVPRIFGFRVYEPERHRQKLLNIKDDKKNEGSSKIIEENDETAISAFQVPKSLPSEIKTSKSVAKPPNKRRRG